MPIQHWRVAPQSVNHLLGSREAFRCNHHLTLCLHSSEPAVRYLQSVLKLVTIAMLLAVRYLEIRWFAKTGALNKSPLTS
eukprot:1127236-Pleurochrysis_carterae.AAC.2